jgi:hypothetical protein
MYENRKMRTIKIILGIEGRIKRRIMKGVRVN